MFLECKLMIKPKLNFIKIKYKKVDIEEKKNKIFNFFIYLTKK